MKYRFWKKYSLLLACCLLFFLPHVVSAQTPIGVTPKLYCLGSCPIDVPPSVTPTTISLTNAPTVVSGTIAPTTSATSSPTPTVNPCATEGSAISHGGGKHKKKYKGEGSGFFEEFFRLLFRLFEMFFGGRMPTAPETPAPTGAAPLPTINPCITPTTPEVTLVPSQPVTIVPTIITPTNTADISCSNPVWTSSDPNGMWEINGFFIHNNMWNVTNYPETQQTMYACAQNNWYVTATANDNKNDGAVKTYPNAHKDYNGVPLSSFTSLMSSYVHKAPAVGNWNVAYDIWINGIASSGSTEVMIWTEARGKQAEAVKTYPSVGSVTLSGISYNVYKNNNYIVFEMSPYKNSGDINLKEIFDYIISRGFIPATSTLGQIDYGVEIVSTDGSPATFQFSNFSINSN